MTVLKMSDGNLKGDGINCADKTIVSKSQRMMETRSIWLVVVVVLICTFSGALIGSQITRAMLENGQHSDESFGPFRIISRSAWQAEPPETNLTKLELPVSRVIIASTKGENCTSQADCAYKVQLIQRFHKERGWDDIGYNFLVGGDGAVYVGRGWDDQGSHTKGYNVNSICIAFIGTFNKITPPNQQLYAAQKIIEEGVKLKKINSDYDLYAQCQLIPGDSPGKMINMFVKKWDHWREKILNNTQLIS